MQLHRKYIFWYPFPLYPIRTENSIQRRARKHVWEQAPPIYRQASNSSTPVDILYYQTCKVYKKRLRKRKRQQELLRGKINESCKCDDLERREEIVVFAIKVTRCFELSVLTIYPIAFCWLSITAIYLLLSISTIFQYFKLTIPSTYSLLAIYFIMYPLSFQLIASTIYGGEWEGR